MTHNLMLAGMMTPIHTHCTDSLPSARIQGAFWQHVAGCVHPPFSFSTYQTLLVCAWVQYDVILGRGAFKTVYKAFDEEEGLEVSPNPTNPQLLRHSCASQAEPPVACWESSCGRYTNAGADRACAAPFWQVAWNQVKVNDLVSSPAERERLFAEIRVLKQLKHKNIMTFYDSWLDQKNMTVNFITELFTSGTLRQ